ncbi:hypothetical protein ACIA74_21830 [Streptomyces sp. NPDC051658]|uniref:hypothetical protein n=1 Tax=Streptomyces sp. NPDC051658 TaxID=3365667 RepID=UPI0037B66E23
MSARISRLTGSSRRRASSSMSAAVTRFAGGASAVAESADPAGPVLPDGAAGFTGAALTGTPVIPASAAAR